VRDVTTGCGEFQNGTRGLKARFLLGLNAAPSAHFACSGQALKGRSSTGLSTPLPAAKTLVQEDGRIVGCPRAACGDVEERRFSAALMRPKTTGLQPLRDRQSRSDGIR
jgi:hypothetical protein